MITINLLPEELRTHEKKIGKIPGLEIGLGLGALFLIVTAFFYVDLIGSKHKLKKLETEWAAIQPHYQRLNQLQQEVETVLKPEKAFLEQFVTTQTPLTHRLTWVSEFLPGTAWLTEIKLEHKAEEGESFFIKGLALPSKEKSSIAQIETYLNDLKKKMADANLSLTTTRQKLEGVDLTQFVANFQWASKK